MLVLHASPHPDDELIGAPATLMALRDAGHEVVNLPCSFGRPDDADTRRAELEEACRRAGFELVADVELGKLLNERSFDLVIGPSPHDRHPAHETVARALVEAAPERLWLWGLWGALPFPTTVVEYDDARLREIHHALEAHESQIARNDFRRLVTGRGLASTVLGAELVYGFGSPGLAGPYAELTTEVVRTPDGWRLGAPRALDPSDPFPEPTECDIGGWLHARSAVDAYDYRPAAMDEAPLAGRSLHFVGIGGAGMSGLALVASSLGARVTGSDRVDSPVLERLRDAGVEIAVGHDAVNLPAGAELVFSTAIPDDNPELAAARAAGTPALHRADLLGELSRMKRTIAVSGAHGKTTTASMAAHALRGAGRDPAFLIGGELRSAGANAGWGTGEWAVIEADESDRSFLKLSRDVAVITNIELDHHSTYATLGDLERAFADFAEPAELRVVGPDVELEGLRVGIDEGDLQAESVQLLPGRVRFEVEGTPVDLPVPGRHNVLNALAALAACRAAGVELADAAAALADFSGAGRRFEEHGRSAGGALVYDDYAHHPTEVRATLEAARTLAEADGLRLVACFQPHLYSRTRVLARDFGRALALADLVVATDIYPARERAEDFPGVSGLLVAQAAADAAGGRPVWWLPELDQATLMLAAELGERDLLVTLGAGDVDRVARELTA